MVKISIRFNTGPPPAFRHRWIVTNNMNTAEKNKGMSRSKMRRILVVGSTLVVCQSLPTFRNLNGVKKYSSANITSKEAGTMRNLSWSSWNDKANQSRKKKMIQELKMATIIDIAVIPYTGWLRRLGSKKYLNSGDFVTVGSTFSVNVRWVARSDTPATAPPMNPKPK